MTPEKKAIERYDWIYRGMLANIPLNSRYIFTKKFKMFCNVLDEDENKALKEQAKEIFNEIEKCRVKIQGLVCNKLAWNKFIKLKKRY